MPELRDVQHAIAEAILAGPGAPIHPSLREVLRRRERINIHRNHFYTTLTEALQATYPVVCRLVGERFFRQAAKRYIADHPPAGPCLFEYGGSFSEFLARYEPASALVYLPDVARLEWALNEALHAPDSPTLDLAAVARLSPDALGDLFIELHPACRLVASPFPIDRIWRANRDESDETIDLGLGAARLLIRRSADAPEFAAIAETDFTLLKAITDGTQLGAAFERMLAVDPSANPARTLLRLANAGVFAAHSVNQTTKGGLNP
ncbi:MAG: DNA-binding domain-containing protein [Alphaproteobacteria bacterium]